MTDHRRRFNATERAVLYLAGDGRCAECGVDLEPGWHSDHVVPHVAGGVTDVINGQALCPPCNLKKGARVTDDLREWQREAIRRYDAKATRDFLVCATPGAGKTVLALTLAQRLLDERTVQRVVVVVPTDSLRDQWAEEAAQVGIDLIPVKADGVYEKDGYHGCVVTYAQLAVGAGASLLRRVTGRPTVALLDEIHHAGDSRAWGDGLQHALEHATRRIGLTGTPWRHDRSSPIPFVTYNAKGKVVVDSEYEYGAAVADEVCRRIEFHAYDGEARWIDCGQIVSTQMGPELSDDEQSAVLQTILDPDRDWMPGILRPAVTALDELRRDVPDAGGLLIADRQDHAERYAAQLQELTGEPATVVVSRDTNATDKIDEFRKGKNAWLVAVKMVSEGVDIKRLAVGVYATSTRTPLFFRQVVGRFVRTRPGEEINAKLFIPAVPAFTTHAREIENELRHQLDLERARDEREARERAEPSGQGALDLREPLSASEARFAESIFGGQVTAAEKHARAEEFCRSAGIPTMWAPNLVRQGLFDEPETPPAATAAATAPVSQAPPTESRARREKMLRAEIKTLVGKVAHRAMIEPQEVNADLLRKGFPPRAKCSISQLEAVRAELALWLDAL